MCASSPSRIPTGPRLQLVDVGLLAVALVLGATQVSSVDGGIHVRFGQILLSEHRVPGHEDVGLGGALEPSLNMSLLAEALMALLYRVLDAPGLQLWVLLGSVAVTLLLLRELRHLGLGPAGRGAIVLLALLQLSWRLLARPELMTLLCMAVLCSLLLGATRSERPGRWLWWTPPLMALWINCHGLWIAGLAVLLLSLTVMRPRRLMVLIGLASLVALTLHPAGLLAAQAPFITLLADPGASQLAIEHTGEFRWLYDPELPRTISLDLARLSVPGIPLLALLTLRPWQRDRRSPATLVILAALTVVTVLALRYMRCLGLATIPQTLTLGLIWRVLIRDATAPPRGTRLGGLLVWGGIALVLVLAGSSWLYGLYGSLNRPGWGWNREQLPVEASRFLAREAPGARALTSFTSGSTTSLFIAPGGRVFVHSLTVTMREEVFRDYQALFEGDASLDEMDGRYAFTHAVIWHRGSDTPGILAKLGAHPGWHLIHLDPVGAVWVNEPGTDVPPPQVNSLEEREQVWIGEFYVASGAPSRARPFLEAAARSGTRQGIVYSNLGAMALQAGDRAQARRWLDLGVTRGADHPLLWYTRGVLLHQEGDPPAALEEFQHAIRRDPRVPLYRLAAAEVLLQLGRADEARSELLRARELDPDGPLGAAATRMLSVLPPGR